MSYCHIHHQDNKIPGIILPSQRGMGDQDRNPLDRNPLDKDGTQDNVLSCLVLSCLVLSCLVLSCLVLSCLVLSCVILFCVVFCLVVDFGFVLCCLLSCPEMFPFCAFSGGCPIHLQGCSLSSLQTRMDPAMDPFDPFSSFNGGLHWLSQERQHNTVYCVILCCLSVLSSVLCYPVFLCCVVVFAVLFSHLVSSCLVSLLSRLPFQFIEAPSPSPAPAAAPTMSKVEMARKGFRKGEGGCHEVTCI